MHLLNLNFNNLLNKLILIFWTRRNMEEQLEQQPAKKMPTDNRQEQPENRQGNDANLANSPEEIDKVLGNPSMVLATSRPLPLELNCEIFKCLKLPIQRKFIWRLGRDIYGMFGQKLLKKLRPSGFANRNPHGISWNKINTRATVAADGLHFSNNTNGWPTIYAEKGFPISGPQCRVNEFPGTILYYYEVKGDPCNFGLSDGAIPEDDDDNLWIGKFSNSYATIFWFECLLAGERHPFELPDGSIQPEPRNVGMNVMGCGLVLDSDNKLAIFFTLNGCLLGRKIPISPTVDRLFPTIKMSPRPNAFSFEINFGDEPAKPFEYDIHNCPGLELACI